MKKNPLLKFIIAAEEESAAKKTLKETKRVDSLSADDISKLYNLKVNKKGRNIVEEAHPGVLVAFDSYDKLNGVLKNDNQKQDITINIIHRKQHAGLVNEKYAAQSKLLSSLVKSANFLDARDPALALYADKIINDFDKQVLQKEALAPAAGAAGLFATMPAWSMIAIPAALVGILYWQQHSDAAQLGFVQNTQRMIDEIDDILNDKAYIVGRTYSDQFKKILNTAKTQISQLWTLYEQVKDKLTTLRQPTSAEELLEISKDLENQELVAKFNDFKNKAVLCVSYLESLKTNLDDDEFTKMQVDDKGALTKIVDRLKYLSGGSGLFKNDIDDVQTLITPTVDSLKKLVKVFEAASVKSKEVLNIGMNATEKSTQKDTKSEDGVNIEFLKRLKKRQQWLKDGDMTKEEFDEWLQKNAPTGTAPHGISPMPDDGKRITNT